MATKFRIGIAALVFAAFVGVTETISAPVRLPRGAPPPEVEKPVPPVNIDMKVNVKNIAELLKDGNASGAKRLAADAARSIRDDDDIADLMDLFKHRHKGGLGWSSTPHPTAGLDGLERMVFSFAKKVAPNDLKKTTENEEAAYWIAALAELTAAAAPAYRGDMRRKVKKDWFDQAGQQRDGAIELAKASAAGDADGMMKAAGKINGACLSCHAVYRD